MSTLTHRQLWQAARVWEARRNAAFIDLREANQRGLTSTDIDLFTARMDASSQELKDLCAAVDIKAARHLAANSDGTLTVLDQEGAVYRLSALSPRFVAALA